MYRNSLIQTWNILRVAGCHFIAHSITVLGPRGLLDDGQLGRVLLIISFVIACMIPIFFWISWHRAPNDTLRKEAFVCSLIFLIPGVIVLAPGAWIVVGYINSAFGQVIAILLTAATTIVVIGAFVNPQEHSQTCPSCGYEMKELPICPECGKARK